MCTSVSARIKGKRLFSRNLDLEYDFGDGIIAVPREFEAGLLCGEKLKEHYAFMGIGKVVRGYPLIADGMNEWGLCIAGLRYPTEVGYPTLIKGDFLAPFEIIPYLLATCKDTEDVKRVLKKYPISDIPFDCATKNEPMHFHVSAEDGDLVLEPNGGEIFVYENGECVLTNAPSFDMQIANLRKYREGNAYKYGVCCEGARGIGSPLDVIPADYSSPSRFVRAVWLLKFLEEHAESREDLYGLMQCVAPPKGAITKDGALHYTRYTAIMDTETLCYSVRREDAEYTLSMTEVLANGESLYTSHFK